MVSRRLKIEKRKNKDKYSRFQLFFSMITCWCRENQRINFKKFEEKVFIVEDWTPRFSSSIE